MKVLFLTIGSMESIEGKGIYPDLLRYFKKQGHEVYTVSPYEKRTGLATQLVEDNGAHMLHVSIGNITKCGFIEKGISTLQVESKFLSAIKKYFGDVIFDLIMYSTPPITFAKVIKYVKKRDNARTYLLLKDIFPQNAIDIGILSKKGIKGVIYGFFRRKEKNLYHISDTIGCMSEANKAYVLKHNKELEPSKVSLCPNCIEIQNLILSQDEIVKMRKKYDIPLDKRVFVYGGNLGKPQDIPFIIQCLKTQEDNIRDFFLVVGDGSEFNTLEEYFSSKSFSNMRLMRSLPKEDYDAMIASCDVGMLFLDHRFTIPNYPSRMLSYMQVGIPILACTDSNTDVGKNIVDGDYGWWCLSDDAQNFAELIKAIQHEDLSQKKENSLRMLKEKFDVSYAYEAVMGNLYNR